MNDIIQIRHAHRVRGYILFCLLVFFACTTYAQQYHFRTLARENGLPSSYMFDMARDVQGYLWFATLKGVARYDGKDFVSFGAREGFRDVGCYRIFRSRSGRLWFISLNYHLYYYENGKFVRTLPEELIQWVDQGENLELTFLTRYGKLISFSDQSLQVTGYRETKNVAYYLTVLRAGQGMIVTGHQDVHWIKGKEMKIIPVEKKSNIILRSKQLSDGRILLYNHEGIHLFDLASFSVSLLMKLPGADVFCTYEDHLSHDVWMGTTSGALCFRKGIISEASCEKFLSASVTSISMISDDMMWFTTFGKGVYFGNPRAKHFTVAKDRGEDIVHLRKQGTEIYALGRNGTVFRISNGPVPSLAIAYVTGGIFGKAVQRGEGPMYITLSNGVYRLEKKKNGTHCNARGCCETTVCFFFLWMFLLRATSST